MMAAKTDCPEWQYKNSPNYPTSLEHSHEGVLKKVRAQQFTIERDATDLRQLHLELFKDLTPAGHEYFAGNYRGHHKHCLKNYEVGVGGDRRVGTAASEVAASIRSFSDALRSTVTKFDQAINQSAVVIDPRSRIVAVVQFACAAFVNYLTIHPFADGNGHAARGLLWILLGKFGYEPTHWTIDPRPTFPDYVTLIAMHRDGKTNPLVQFVLTCISPRQT